jgi:hypothetical protein
MAPGAIRSPSTTPQSRRASWGLRPAGSWRPAAPRACRPARGRSRPRQLPLPPAPDAPAPARLILSLDGHKDGRPPATGSWALDADHGEVEFPLPLEDRDYTVRASAASEEGLTDPAATVPLPREGASG